GARIGGVLVDGEVDIFVVDDNESEREAIGNALHITFPEALSATAGDGDEAVDFLFGRGKWTDRQGGEPPRRIVLDLGLPRAGGLEVLGLVRSSSAPVALLFAPVVIFSDSQSEETIKKCYLAGANSYIVKPLSVAGFNDIVMDISRYWLTRNRATF